MQSESTKHAPTGKGTQVCLLGWQTCMTPSLVSCFWAHSALEAQYRGSGTIQPDENETAKVVAIEAAKPRRPLHSSQPNCPDEERSHARHPEYASMCSDAIMTFFGNRSGEETGSGDRLALGPHTGTTSRKRC